MLRVLRAFMDLITQPKRSRLCGQACIAMVLGISLDEAIKLVGHRRGTITRDLRAALKSRGVTLGPPMLTQHHELPSEALAIVRASKGISDLTTHHSSPAGPDRRTSGLITGGNER